MKVGSGDGKNVADTQCRLKTGNICLSLLLDLRRIRVRGR